MLSADKYRRFCIAIQIATSTKSDVYVFYTKTVLKNGILPSGISRIFNER